MTPTSTFSSMDSSSSHHSICVFCGAGEGTDPAFAESARRLAELFYKHNFSLGIPRAVSLLMIVYGGGTTGIMGAVAGRLVELGGNVHGIIPKALLEYETSKERPSYGRTTVVGDMHTRKRLMAKESSAFIALPGGFGTMEELMEVVTWSQLGIHSCPIILLNVSGFYSPLLEWINVAVKSGFIKPANASIVVEAKTVEEVIEKLQGYEVPESRYPLDWTVQSPLEKHKELPNGDSDEKCFSNGDYTQA